MVARNGRPTVTAAVLEVPRFAAATREVADVRGVDVVERVLLWVGERDAERAAAGEGEVIGVATWCYR
jgi:hypothetical protein